MITKTRLRKFASLIVRQGVNVQPGQEVMISAGLDQPDFVRMVVEEAYRAGARKVSVDWSYQPVERAHYRYAKEKVLGTLDKWQIERWEHQAEVLPCKIYLLSDDPDGLRGLNQKKLAAVNQMRASVIKPIRNRMNNRYQWCIAAVPGEAWAKKLFPGERASTAVNHLWEAILSTSRVTEDPAAAWDEHNRNLQGHCDHLNALGLVELHYQAKNGTDFTVGLNPDVLFAAGGEKTTAGIFFNPNIPTEEVFTSPMRGKAEGIVYATKPLSYAGSLIENFWIRFHEGKAVGCGAERGKELLDSLLGMDEGSSYLGEVALVPYSSPIEASGLLFYNTLFDENAACHLALGHGFTNLHKNYDALGEEGAYAAGINDSIMHVDFMIGCADLSITGKTADGKEVAIFRNGEFAF